MDSIDAKVIKREEGLAQNVVIGKTKIPIDSLMYDMKHQNRGKCLIFNHQIYDSHTGCKPRLGSDRDANALTKCFHNLQFDVILYNDLNLRDIRQELMKITSEDHSEKDCIVVAVLTHGDEESLWARDRKYPIESFLSFFRGNNCPTLVGKPKIFIIQACRGDRLDAGVEVRAVGMDVVDGRQPTYKIPSIADFLIYYSTAPGHYSFRNTQNGSYFVQTLASVLNQYSYKYNIDLLTLLTLVNQRVAFEYESYVPNNRQFNTKKQIPCISSMLTRLIYFTPKPQLN